MILSIINNKGGTQKTSTTLNLGNALANKNKKVLIIDQDPQSNSTLAMMPQALTHVGDGTLYDLYAGTPNVTVADCIHPTLYENLFILPNLAITATLEPAMYGNIGESYFKGREITNQIKNDYDYIFYDCPPSLGLWVLIALISSDAVIVPLEAGSRYSLTGLVAAIDAIEAISKTTNPSLRFLRLLINRVDLRTSASKATVEFIRSKFGSKVFETTIPESTQVKQAELAGKTVLRHAPQSVASRRYRELADEFLSITEKNVPEELNG